MISKRKFAALVVLALWIVLTAVTVATANAWQEASLAENVLFDENQIFRSESTSNARPLVDAASRLLNAKLYFYRELGFWTLLTLCGAGLLATPEHGKS